MTSRLPYIIGLAILSILFYLPGIQQLPIMDRDAARFAQASKQMLENKTPFRVQFQQEPRHKKPPGIYWAQAISASVAGPSYWQDPWPYRLPSFFFGFLSMAALFTFWREELGASQAFAAAVLLGMSTLFCMEARTETTDAAQLFAVITAQGFLWHLYKKQRSAFKAYGFWLSLALIFLFKGVGLLIPLMTVIVLLITDSERQWIRQLQPISGGLLWLFAFLCWVLPLNYYSQTNFLLDMIRIDLAPKILQGQEHHGFFFGYHSLLLLLTFWPGSLLLVGALPKAWQERKKPLMRFVLAWLSSWWVFECVSTKLPQYALPMFPAIALISVLALNRSIQGRCWRVSSWIWLGLTQCLIAIPILGWVYLQENPLSVFTVSAWILYWLITTILAHCAVFTSTSYQRLWKLIVLTVIIYTAVFQISAPKWRTVWLTEQIVGFVKTHPEFTPSKTQPLHAYGYTEPSLTFRLGTEAVVYHNHSQFPHSARWLLLPCDTVTRIYDPKTGEKARLAVLGQFEGFRYPKGKWVCYNWVERHPSSSV